MKKHLNITVSGQVTGVGFRWEAREQAKRFGLSGFVRNEPDGSVYIEAEGEDAPLEQFLDWCRQGPELAKIGNVATEEAPLKNFTEFKIVN